MNSTAIEQDSKVLAPVLRDIDEKAFYALGESWEANVLLEKERSVQRAWRVAYGAIAVAIILAIAVVVVAHIPRLIPYLMLQDKATGNLEFVGRADGHVSMEDVQDLKDKNAAWNYVLARESYYYPILQTDYDNVLAWSSDDVGSDYAKQYDGDNARDKRLGQGTLVVIKLISVQTITDAVGTKAVVRYSKHTRRADADNTDPPQTWVATLSYEWKPSTFGKEKYLIANPEGYKVTAWRADEEMTQPYAKSH